MTSRSGAERVARPAVTDLLYSLCSIHAKDDSRRSRLYRHSLNLLGSHITPSVLPDEFRLSERIQKMLVKQNKEGDAVTFTELHQKLTAQQVLQKQPAILLFLLILSGSSDELRSKATQSSLLLGAPGLGAGLLPTPPGPPPSNPTPSSTFTDSRTLVGSSGIGSMTNGDTSSIPSLYTHLRPGVPSRPAPQLSSTPALGATPAGPPPTTSRGEAWSEIRPHPLGHASVAPPPPTGRTTSTSAAPQAKAGSEVSEAALLRDIIFVLQGIEGEYIRFDTKHEAYRLEKTVSVSSSVRELCHKLCELGWLYRKVRLFIDSKGRDKTQGLVCQSFCSALSTELTEYYRLVAVLEAQHAQAEGGVAGGRSLTLRRLVVWSHDPLKKLKILGTLVDACKRLKGGGLVSTLYGYSQHGDPYVQTLIKNLLNQVYQPLNTILNQWIFEGELLDSCMEFFIACDESCKADKLWRSKYTLRPSMLPCFIAKDLAQKIMTIGKSINFLRQSCQDRTQLASSSLRNWFLSDEGVCTFDSMTGRALQAVVNTSYKSTSKHLMHVLNSNYNFLEHLKALRRYLLLGQGDFIRHLMDLLVPELAKPATSLYLHNLTGTLETAVRATNAQFESTDILNRLDVRILELSPGDCGWDVFSLHYHVTGPISTVFTGETMLKYLRVFNFLWRAKRVEYTLATMWREQTSHCRTLQTIPELCPVLHQCHLLISAMVHFITQLQYYVTFEVMECCWASLLKKVEAASDSDLDHLIDAHEKFLDQIIAECLLDTQSQPILTRLRAIFDLVIRFQQKQTAMLTECLLEVERRRKVIEHREERTEEGLWGTTGFEAELEERRQREFVEHNVATFRSEFVVLQTSFKDMVEEFMSKLASHSEQSLRFLCFRLDFNEYYSSVAASRASQSAVNVM